MVWKTEFKNSAGAVKEGEEPAERESSRDEEWRDVAERNHCALLEIALAMRVSAGFQAMCKDVLVDGKAG